MNDIVDPRTLAAGFWNSLTADDFSAPVVSIGQGTGTKGLPGNFIFNSGDQKPVLLNCKLLHAKKGRVLYSAKSASLCGSDDFYVPAARHKDKMSEQCMTCPLQQWGDNELKQQVKKNFGLSMVNNLEKPMCNETYNLLMADENCNPFFISFSKTQLKVVSEKLLSRLRMGFGQYAPFLVAFDMSLVKKTGPGMSYYTTVFDNFRPIVDGGEAARVTDLYQGWANKAADVLARQYEEMDDEKIVTESGDAT